MFGLAILIVHLQDGAGSHFEPQRRRRSNGWATCAQLVGGVLKMVGRSLMRQLSFITTLITLTTNSALTQDVGRVKQLSEQIVNLMNTAEVPGLSIATIDDGKIEWIGSFGVKDKKTAEKVDAQTVFPAASLGKVVFAYGVLKLMDERSAAVPDSGVTSWVAEGLFRYRKVPMARICIYPHVAAHPTAARPAAQ